MPIQRTRRGSSRSSISHHHHHTKHAAALPLSGSPFSGLAVLGIHERKDSFDVVNEKILTVHLAVACFLVQAIATCVWTFPDYPIPIYVVVSALALVPPLLYYILEKDHSALRWYMPVSGLLFVVCYLSAEGCRPLTSSGGRLLVSTLPNVLFHLPMGGSGLWAGLIALAYLIVYIMLAIAEGVTAVSHFVPSFPMMMPSFSVHPLTFQPNTCYDIDQASYMDSSRVTNLQLAIVMQLALPLLLLVGALGYLFRQGDQLKTLCIRREKACETILDEMSRGEWVDAAKAANAYVVEGYSPHQARAAAVAFKRILEGTATGGGCVPRGDVRRGSGAAGGMAAIDAALSFSESQSIEAEFGGHSEKNDGDGDGGGRRSGKRIMTGAVKELFPSDVTLISAIGAAATFRSLIPSHLLRSGGQGGGNDLAGLDLVGDIDLSDDEGRVGEDEEGMDESDLVIAHILEDKNEKKKKKKKQNQEDKEKEGEEAPTDDSTSINTSTSTASSTPLFPPSAPTVMSPPSPGAKSSKIVQTSSSAIIPGLLQEDEDENEGGNEGGEVQVHHDHDSSKPSTTSHSVVNNNKHKGVVGSLSGSSSTSPRGGGNNNNKKQIRFTDSTNMMIQDQEDHQKDLSPSSPSPSAIISIEDSHHGGLGPDGHRNGNNNNNSKKNKNGQFDISAGAANYGGMWHNNQQSSQSPHVSSDPLGNGGAGGDVFGKSMADFEKSLMSASNVIAKPLQRRQRVCVMYSLPRMGHYLEKAGTCSVEMVRLVLSQYYDAIMGATRRYRGRLLFSSWATVYVTFDMAPEAVAAAVCFLNEMQYHSQHHTEETFASSAPHLPFVVVMECDVVTGVVKGSQSGRRAMMGWCSAQNAFEKMHSCLGSTVYELPICLVATHLERAVDDDFVIVKVPNQTKFFAVIEAKQSLSQSEKQEMDRSLGLLLDTQQPGGGSAAGSTAPPSSCPPFDVPLIGKSADPGRQMQIMKKLPAMPNLDRFVSRVLRRKSGDDDSDSAAASTTAMAIQQHQNTGGGGGGDGHQMITLVGGTVGGEGWQQQHAAEEGGQDSNKHTNTNTNDELTNDNATNLSSPSRQTVRSSLTPAQRMYHQKRACSLSNSGLGTGGINITQPQVSQEVMELWEKFDVDGNGRIEVEEVYDTLISLGMYLTEQDLKEFFKVADRDGSGYITLDEFIESYHTSSSFGGAAVVAKIRKQAQAVTAATEVDQLPVVMTAWRKRDTDGMGALPSPVVCSILKDIGVNVSEKEAELLVVKLGDAESDTMELEDLASLFSEETVDSKAAVVRERVESVKRVMEGKAAGFIFTNDDQQKRDDRMAFKALITRWYYPILLLYVIYNYGMVSYRIAMQQRYVTSNWQIIFDMCSDVVFYVWVLLKLTVITRQLNGQTLYKPKDIRNRYIHSREFLIDVIIVIPLDIFYFVARAATGDDSRDSTLSVYAMWRMNKLLSIYHMDSLYMNIVKDLLTPTLKRISDIMLWFVILSHAFACFLITLARTTDEQHIKDLTNTPTLFGNNTAYSTSLLWAFQILGGQPRGECLPPQSDAQLFLLMAATFFGLPFLAGMLGIIGNAVSIETSESRFLSNIDSLRGYFSYAKDRMGGDSDSKQQFAEVEREAIKYYRHIYDTTGSLDFGTDPLTDVPPELHIQVTVAIGIEMLGKVPIFADAVNSAEFIHELTVKLVPQVIEPDVVVMRKGQKGSNMYFITYGEFHVVIPNGTVVFRLFKGNFFGEIALLHEVKRTATIKSSPARYANVLTLERRDFLEVMSTFPDALSAINKAAEDRLNAIIKQEKEDEEAEKERRRTEKSQQLSSGEVEGTKEKE